MFHIPDGVTVGDGSYKGKCPTTPSNLKCLSTGECKVCKQINDVNEGCDVSSSLPICDPDPSTAQIENTEIASATPACVACKKNSKHFSSAVLIGL